MASSSEIKTMNSYDSLKKREEESEEIKILRNDFLSKKYEITLTDGRIIRGILMCTDKDANMIFYRADERWPDSIESRWIGQVLISKRHVTSMCILTKTLSEKNQSGFIEDDEC